MSMHPEIRSMPLAGSEQNAHLERRKILAEIRAAIPPGRMDAAKKKLPVRKVRETQGNVESPDPAPVCAPEQEFDGRVEVSRRCAHHAEPCRETQVAVLSGRQFNPARERDRLIPVL